MAFLNLSLLLLLLSVEQEHFCLWLLADGTEVTQIRRQQKAWYSSMLLIHASYFLRVLCTVCTKHVLYMLFPTLLV
jgi:hypothetical protein